MVLLSKHQEQFEELNDAIQNVIRLARDGDELPDVTPADLVRAIRSIKKDTALGPDRLSQRSFADYPMRGLKLCFIYIAKWRKEDVFLTFPSRLLWLC